MKMHERQCQKCGLIDSVHVKDHDTSKLVEAIGPRGEKNLQLYFVYCRSCKHMSAFTPAWLGNRRKFAFSIHPDSIPRYYTPYAAVARQEAAIGVPRHVQDALLDRMEAILQQDGLQVKSTKLASS